MRKAYHKTSPVKVLNVFDAERQKKGLPALLGVHVEYGGAGQYDRGTVVHMYKEIANWRETANGAVTLTTI
jgi:hypothetical protein